MWFTGLSLEFSFRVSDVGPCIILLLTGLWNLALSGTKFCLTTSVASLYCTATLGDSALPRGKLEEKMFVRAIERSWTCNTVVLADWAGEKVTVAVGRYRYFPCSWKDNQLM